MIGLLHFIHSLNTTIWKLNGWIAILNFCGEHEFISGHSKSAQPEILYHIITIRDNGIGFPPEPAEKIFGMFVRLHEKGTYKGSGIGLTVCRKIMALHGGFITAESEAGTGATFKCFFPAENA